MFRLRPDSKALMYSNAICFAKLYGGKLYLNDGTGHYLVSRSLVTDRGKPVVYFYHSGSKVEITIGAASADLSRYVVSGESFIDGEWKIHGQKICYPGSPCDDCVKSAADAWSGKRAIEAGVWVLADGDNFGMKPVVPGSCVKAQTHKEAVAEFMKSCTQVWRFKVVELRKLKHLILPGRYDFHPATSSVVWTR